MIDVITPTLNQWQHLDRCKDSVRWQLETDERHLYCDDASDTANYSVHLRNSTRMGASYSRNRLVEESRAEWIKPLDDDDVLAPFALSHFRAMQKDSRVAVVCGAQIVVESGTVRGMSNPGGLNMMRNANPFVPSQVFIRRDALLEIGGFDERIDGIEDWDLWLRILSAHGPDAFAFCGVPFCYYFVDKAERQKRDQVIKKAQSRNPDFIASHFLREHGIELPNLSQSAKEQPCRPQS